MSKEINIRSKKIDVNKGSKTKYRRMGIRNILIKEMNTIAID